ARGFDFRYDIAHTDVAANIDGANVRILAAESQHDVRGVDVLAHVLHLDWTEQRARHHRTIRSLRKRHPAIAASGEGADRIRVAANELDVRVNEHTAAEHAAAGNIGAEIMGLERIRPRTLA